MKNPLDVGGEIPLWGYALAGIALGLLFLFGIMQYPQPV